jgi:exodeoxyribonuclease-3
MKVATYNVNGVNGLVDAQVDRHVRGWEKTSDHAPVWVELADKPKRKRKPPAVATTETEA